MTRELRSKFALILVLTPLVLGSILPEAEGGIFGRRRCRRGLRLRRPVCCAKPKYTADCTAANKWCPIAVIADHGSYRTFRMEKCSNSALYQNWDSAMQMPVFCATAGCPPCFAMEESDSNEKIDKNLKKNGLRRYPYKLDFDPSFYSNPYNRPFRVTRNVGGPFYVRILVIQENLAGGIKFATGYEIDPATGSGALPATQVNGLDEKVATIEVTDAQLIGLVGNRIDVIVHKDHHEP